MAHGGFWHELKRRHVYRVAAAYAIVGWLLIQVATQVFPIFHFPDWIDQAVVLLILIGFPIALVLAWAFDATRQGIVRTDALVESGETATLPLRRSQRAGIAVGLLGVLIALIAGGAYWHFRRPASSPVAIARVASSHDVVVCGSAPCARPSAAVQARSSAKEGAGAARLSRAWPAPIKTESAQPIPAKSVAVLPFDNLSGDPSEKYFSDGITVEILNALAQIPDLKVSGRTSAFQFSSKDQDLRRIGAMLGVADVLVGSVQKAGDEVRITVQLVDTRTGYQRWSEKYDRKLTSIFAVEDDISSAIAGKLRVQLTGGGGQALVVQRLVDPRAHDSYLRGLTLLAARGPGLRDAVADFQNAVKIDPSYADAWGRMADAEVLLPSYGLADISTAQARATSFAQRALALDANTASAYGTLGILYLRRWQWANADAAFRRSLALAPGDAEAIDQYAQFLFVCGQFKSALVKIERAQRLDPLSAIIATMHAGILFALHRDPEATAQIKRALAINPNFGLAHVLGFMSDAQSGRFPQALAHARSSMGPDAAVLVMRGMSDPTLRDKVVQEFETSPYFATLRRDPFAFAQFLALLGARGRALDALENLAADRAVPEPMQIWSPGLDSIRNDPRFKAVLKRMGLPYTPPVSAQP